MQKNMENQLNESNNVFDLIFNNMPQGYCLIQLIFDKKGKPVDYIIEEINSAYEKHTGLKRKEVVGKRAGEFLPVPEPVWFERYGKVVKTGEPARFEVYNEALNNWFEVQVYSLHIDNKIIVIFSDISPNKEKEFKSNFEKAGYIEEIGLLESVNTLFRSVLDCRTEEEIGSVCLKLVLETTCSCNGFIGLMNDKGQLDSIVMYNPESHSGVQAFSGILPFKNYPVQGICKSVLVKGKAIITNDPASYYDGTGLPSVYEPIRSFLGIPLKEKNKAVGIIAVVNRPGGYNENDLKRMEVISNSYAQVLMRWRAEQAFLESDRSYRELFCAIDEGFLIGDILFNESGGPADLLIVQGNQAAERILGINCIGKPFTEVSSDYESCWEEVIGSVVQTGQSVRIERYEERYQKWCSFFVFRIGGEENCRIGNLFRDITERKNRELNAAFLDDIGKDFNRLAPLDDIINSVGEKIKRHFNLSRLVFSDVDISCNQSKVIYDNHNPGMLSALGTGRLSDFLPQEMLREEYRGRVIAVDDIAADSRYAGYEQTYLKMDVRSGMIAPYAKNDSLYFVVVMHCCEPRKWRQEEIRLAGELSSRIYALVERARSQEALIHSEKRAVSLVKELKKLKNDLIAEVEALNTIHSLNSNFIIQYDIETIYKEIIAAAVCLTAAQKGCIQIFNKETRHLNIMASHGLGNDFLRFFGDTDLGTGAGGRAYKKKKRIVLHNIQKSAMFAGKPALGFLTEENICCEQSTPLISSSGKFVGVLNTYYTKNKTFTGREFRMLDMLARMAADLIERTQTDEALKKSREQTLSLVEELKLSDKNKNKFLSALSHELRNPLATIVAGLSLLDLSDERQQTEQAKEIMKRQIDQLCRLVDDLLELTRINNNKIQLKKEKMELNLVALAAAEDHRALFVEKGVKLETQMNAEPIYLCADPVRLAQIIGNLMQNALKFTEKGGNTVLSVSREKNDAVIFVKDDGIGIRRELLSDLFKPFFQADKSMDRSKGGLGLGLSIVKGIAELHGGSVVAQSPGLGKGSMFSIHLPLCLDDVPDEEYKAEWKPGRPLRILVIEDNKDFALILCAALKQMGYTADWAREGKEGIHLAKAIQPDVLFCDIGLPGMNGYEVAQRLRRVKLRKEVFLVALTGYAGAQDIELALQAGFDKHLAKPVELTVLKKILNEVLLKNKNR